MNMKRVSIVMLLMMIAVMSIMAQVTTSSLSGKITMKDGGESIIGATIQALHEPSGTKYLAVSNTDGVYSIFGMRSGGPYVVTVTYIGYNSVTVKDVTLQLGETYNLSVAMYEDATVLGEVVVSAKATKFTTEKTGASTNITSAQIVNMPMVSRSITDVMRLSPYGGNGMSIGGTDGRNANFTVDGANFNNNFGLEDKLPGGGNPISLDALDELQVVVSPYDVRQTNFIGGGINAITKSGTNTFKGTAYIYHRNENLRGDAVNRTQLASARDKESTTTYGFTFGGPILKDKLFFFVNGEMSKSPTVTNRWRGSTDGEADANNFISRTRLDDLAEVSKALKAVYGYDTGSYDNYPADEDNYKILARLDWNISEMHHLSARYNYTKNRNWNTPNWNSMDGGPRMTGRRLSQYSMAYANTLYAIDNLVSSFSVDLNSRLSENLSNQLLATYSKLDDTRYSDSAEFPFIDILKDDQAYMSLGYELFAYNSAVRNTVWNIKDDVTYYLKSHKITAGLSYEYQLADNVYLRNGLGYFRFNSLQDFYDNIGWDPILHSKVTPKGATPGVVALDYAYLSNPEAVARVRTGKFGIYVQDEWNITEKLKLTYGLRMDRLLFNNDDIMTNKKILELDYNGKHIDTGCWPKSTLTASPRLGFVWDVLGDKSLKVRGGTGLFSGRLPMVFFVNMPSNSGMIKSRITTTSDEFKQNFSKYLGVDGYPTLNALKEKVYSLGYSKDIRPEDGVLQGNVTAVDPSFKMPQVWKTSVAVDYVIPVSFPLSVTLEGIFNKTINGVYVTDWSVPAIDGFTKLNGADDRVLYPSDYRTNPAAFVMSNTSKGYGWSANLTVNATPAGWLNIMAAYTHTVNKELSGMPGSETSSCFASLPTVNGPGSVRLHNSQYVIPDRLVAAITLNDRMNNHYSFVYEAWRGSSNYSFMTTNDVNGDGYNNDLVYIPTDKQVSDGQFRFVSDDDRNRFMDFVHSDSYLSSHQGKYAEAYSLYAPWVHRLDFSYKHDFKFGIGNTKHNVQLSLDVKNLLNLFNSSWGVCKFINPEIGSEARILKYEGVDAQGFATFSTPSAINGSTKVWTPRYDISQCWYASVGIKYIFN